MLESQTYFNMKSTCKYCLQEKAITEFKKTIYKKGYGSICKECANARARAYNKRTGFVSYKKYEKTPSGYLMRTYRNMKSRVTGIQYKKAHLYQGLELLDKESFYQWALADAAFFSLYNAYVDSGYQMKLAPSIDRIDSSKGYTFDNIRWLSHSENSRNGNYSRFNKTVLHENSPLI